MERPSSFSCVFPISLTLPNHPQSHNFAKSPASLPLPPPTSRTLEIRGQRSGRYFALLLSPNSQLPTPISNLQSPISNLQSPISNSQITLPILTTPTRPSFTSHPPLLSSPDSPHNPLIINDLQNPQDPQIPIRASPKSKPITFCLIFFRPPAKFSCRFRQSALLSQRNPRLRQIFIPTISKSRCTKASCRKRQIHNSLTHKVFHKSRPE